MFKLLIGIFITINCLYSSSIDLIKFYRKDGIKAVENMIEKQLQKQSYWEQSLKDGDYSKGYYESIRFLIQCNKEQKKLELYDLKTNTNILTTPVIVGQLKGDKQKEGDLKTPIGVYRLTKKLTKIDPFYGALALTTNYPNIYDKINKKTGHGIWIHGVPYDKKRDNYTKGCLALQNDKLVKLDSKILLKKAILQISANSIENVTKKQIAKILSSLYLWKYAWKKSDLDAYLSFYDKEFKRANGQSLESFKKYKKKVFAKKEDKTIRFKNINIIPYPNIKNEKMFQIIFDEEYKTKSINFNGKKILYIKLENDIFSILAEK
jgi:murein L,D-transpeptidase YafK